MSSRAKTTEENGRQVATVVAVVDCEEGARSNLVSADYELRTVPIRTELDRFL